MISLLCRVGGRIRIAGMIQKGVRAVLDLQKIKAGVSMAAMEYPIAKAELFGSYADGREQADSDVDLLVEFTKPRVSLLTLNALKFRLEELLGTDVDLIHGPLPEGSMIEIDRRIPLYGA